MTETNVAFKRPNNPFISRLIKAQVVIAVIIVVLSVVVGLQIPALLKEKSRLQKDVTDKQMQLDKINGQLDDARKVLLAINPILEKYGVLKKLTVDDLNSDLVKQSFEANQEIQRALAKANSERPIPVWYFSKDVNVDPRAVREALQELRFDVLEKNAPRPDLPSNTVSFGESISPDEAKLVVYTLIRAGIPIKAMCRNPRTGAVIQVYGDERLLNKPPVTVQQIRNKDQFISCPSREITEEWPSEY